MNRISSDDFYDYPILRLTPLWIVMKPFLLSYDRLPDVSDDTPENNPILRYREMPDFNLPPDKVITGTAKFSQDYEVALQEHLKNLQGSNILKQLTFNQLHVNLN